MKAFPWGHNQSIDGMDLRDYFAAKALQGMVERAVKLNIDPDFMAEDSYKIADAMMKAREK
jgi:hypothetical protein